MLAAAAAGCGGERSAAPGLPAQVADGLAAQSDAVAQRLDRGDPCGARTAAEALQTDAIAAVNAGRVPRRFQEELVSSIAALVGSVECAPEPTAEDGEHEEGKGKGKARGKRKHDDEDGEEGDD